MYTSQMLFYVIFVIAYVFKKFTFILKIKLYFQYIKRRDFKIICDGYFYNLVICMKCTLEVSVLSLWHKNTIYS